MECETERLWDQGQPAPLARPVSNQSSINNKKIKSLDSNYKQSKMKNLNFIYNSIKIKYLAVSVYIFKLIILTLFRLVGLTHPPRPPPILLHSCGLLPPPTEFSSHPDALCREPQWMRARDGKDHVISQRQQFTALSPSSSSCERIPCTIELTTVP